MYRPTDDYAATAAEERRDVWREHARYAPEPERPDPADYWEDMDAWRRDHGLIQTERTAS